MKNKIIIRKDTFSLAKEIIIYELISSIVFFLANFLIVYEDLENKSPLSYILDIDAASIFLFMLASILLIFIVFLHWYLRSGIYFTSSSIFYHKGLFLRIDNIDFQDIESISYKPDIIGEYLHFGTILLTKKSNKKIIPLDNITNAEYYINIIKRRIEYNKYTFLPKEQVLEWIHGRENETVEFKQTLRLDIKLSRVNKELEKAVMKEICGFMNAKGGLLLIGVDDEGNITGLEADYKTLKRNSRDYFENYLRQIFDSMIGKEFIDLIDIDFYDFEGKDICLIRILPGYEPVYLKSNNNNIFYIRAGNATKPLNVKEANKYIRLHF